MSHLQFPDETILFFEASLEVARKVQRILNCFEARAGLQIKFQKLSLFPIGVSDELHAEVADVLDCALGHFPFTYLSSHWQILLVYVNHELTNSRSNRTPKLHDRIVKLRNEHLRFRIPEIAQNIHPNNHESKVRKLLHEASKNRKSQFPETREVGAEKKGGVFTLNRKLARVSWDTVCRPRKFGGLGVVDLRLRNLSLLEKWAWRFATELSLLWRAVLVVKYGEATLGWRINVVRLWLMSSVWKQIVSTIVSPELSPFLDVANYSWKVGSGTKVLFWLDPWCIEVLLKEVFPRLFLLALKKFAWVSDYTQAGSFTPALWVRWELWYYRFSLGNQCKNGSFGKLQCWVSFQSRL
ncbi:hypothetical protein GQ457_15G018850 [Hibiscus cannabinus]